MPVTTPTTRRRFLTAAALGAAAGGGVLTAPAARAAAPGTGVRPGRVPLTREEHRAVVIGSGFGGGVTALRLAQAGVPVTVLERGRRWVTGPGVDTYATVSRPDRRLLWYGTTPEAVRPVQRLVGGPLDLDPYVGVVEPVLGDSLLAVCAAGVGGGSLVYQGMTLQPSREVFETWMPGEWDYGRLDREYYPRVARMLRVSPAPDELLATPTYRAARIFRDRAERRGFPVEKVPLPVDWDYPLAETRGEMKPAYTSGDTTFGINNGGKHTVDVTYLAQAEATGRCRVLPQHRVTSVARGTGGRWTVHVDRIDEAGRVLEQKILTTNALVMAAGSINTTRLLVRAAALGGIPGLPDDVGRGFGTNGDRLYLWTDLVDDFGARQGSPVTYVAKTWDEPRTATTVCQFSVPPLYGINTRSTLVLAMAVSPDRGRWTYNGLTDTVNMHFPVTGDRAISLTSARRVQAIAAGLGTVANINLAVNFTVHPLGGACTGPVADPYGRVHGQPGLYVLDGALIPGTTAACNPSMTIAAVAEQALDDIVAKDVGTTI
ncbi:GMC family oxidoreductase [Streptomyces lycii]|uniref:Cholesterol oxidase n=1 Tax=Streptomyces lycii TaxID=2654337 RepID=A0ABQ7FK49_9ACTN|nr:GMC family oxidoreductase [Streptomyces lycii]